MKTHPRRIIFLALIFLATGLAPNLRAQSFEIGAHLAVHSLPELGDTRTGYGFRFTYSAFVPFVALDSEINFLPTSPTGNLGEKQVFVGLRAGAHVGKWGVYAKARPGFADFSGGGFPRRLTSSTHFALDLGGVIEYDVVPLIALRWDLSEVLTDFGGASLIAGPGYVGAPLHNQRNFQTTLGAVLRF